MKRKSYAMGQKIGIEFCADTSALRSPELQNEVFGMMSVISVA